MTSTAHETINPNAFLSHLLYTTHLEQKSTREGYGSALLDYGAKNPNIVALSADLTKSTGTEKFAKAFPDRFFQVGVAEQNMTSVSAGLALSGKTVFMATYAAFSPGRNYDFIRTQIAYSKANVKIISTHAGLSSSFDGATHQMLEDVSMMRTIPNITVLTPSDYFEGYKAVERALEVAGPVYIRLYRNDSPVFTSEKTAFVIGTWNILKHGSKTCIISYGPVLYESILAAKALEEKGISTQVVGATSIKPLDEKLLTELADKFETIFTVEEHQVSGGLGGAVSEFLSTHKPIRVIRLGIKDDFGESGKYEELLHKHKIDEKGITESVLEYFHV